MADTKKYASPAGPLAALRWILLVPVNLALIVAFQAFFIHTHAAPLTPESVAALPELPAVRFSTSPGWRSMRIACAAQLPRAGCSTATPPAKPMLSGLSGACRCRVTGLKRMWIS